jgi:carbon monoxide dehydrogenase subunit G
MELVGEQIINASRSRVWAAINDPDILSRCIPGCEELTQVSDTERHARVALKVGPVRARFSGRIFMSDMVAPSGCKISFEGSGGAAGFAKGHSAVELSETGAQTTLRYTVSASVGGKLGQIGGRLIDASAKKVADEFFTAFDRALSDSSSSAAAPNSAEPDAIGHGVMVDGAQGTTPARGNAVGQQASAAPRQVAAAGPVTVPRVGVMAALAGEVSRVLWFGLGVGTTLLVMHLAR